MQERRTALTFGWVGLLVGLLAGCGGSGGSDSGQRTSVQISAAPSSVSAGQSTYLSWTSENATSCEASGGWSGAQPTTGSFRTAAISTETTFALNCSGTGSAAVARVTVGLGDGSGNVSLKSVPASVPANGVAVLQWSSKNAGSCSASGDWSGVKASAGSERVSGITRDSSFRLTCVVGDQTSFAMTSVVVQRATLRWSAPDPTIHDVAGYHVFWGPDGNRRQHKTVVQEPSARSQVIDLPGPGTYYFAMSTFDLAGADGARSNEVSKLIP